MFDKRCLFSDTLSNSKNLLYVALLKHLKVDDLDEIFSKMSLALKFVSGILR